MLRWVLSWIISLGGGATVGHFAAQNFEHHPVWSITGFLGGVIIFGTICSLISPECGPFSLPEKTEN